jgi:repressor LexA
MTGLTSKQQRLFEAIERYTATHGCPPSYRELMRELGYVSTASIYRFVKALKEKGYIENTPRSWRNVVAKSSRHVDGQVVEIEVIGRVSRHRPPELFAKTYLITIPNHMVSPEMHVYGLSIQDASFLDEHILPGDLILVEPTDAAESGELVLASTHITIIGHYYDEGNSIRFRSSPYAPSNAVASTVTKVDETQIWGVIIGILRSFIPKQ